MSKTLLKAGEIQKRLRNFNDTNWEESDEDSNEHQDLYDSSDDSDENDENEINNEIKQNFIKRQKKDNFNINNDFINIKTSSDDEEDQILMNSNINNKLYHLNNLKNELKKTEKKKNNSYLKKSSVIYIGHLPRQFQEFQILKYFTQFGKIRRLRLSRSKRTGQPKGYAFLEFMIPDVAKIAAETMDGYILDEKRLSCEVIPRERLHSAIWKGASRKFKYRDLRQREKKRYNQSYHFETQNQWNKKIKKLLKNEAEKRQKLKELGIEYEFEGYQGDYEERILPIINEYNMKDIPINNNNQKINKKKMKKKKKKLKI